MQNHDLDIKIYNISDDTIKINTVLSVVRKKGRSGFYFGCAAHTKEETAITKSLKEGLSGFVGFYEHLFIHKTIECPKSQNEIVTLDDHCAYYLAGNGDYLLDELFVNVPKKPLLYRNYSFEQLVKQLQELNIDIFYRNLTTVDVASEGLAVVRVVVPKLQYLPVGAAMLESDRLREYMKKFDIKEHQLNLNAHPFP
jgi:ribosomal protein S12 methylthiotransferase accessory factor